MATLAHDAHPTAGARTASGIGFAVLSALAFGLSGALARPMLEAGWSPGATTLVRVGLGAAVVVPFGIRALRGRWAVLRRNAGLILLYGALAVTAAQFCYFSAVEHMPVAPALLIEFTAPAAVVVWLWLVHGQRPRPITLVGALVAALGLVLVLDLLSGADLSAVGVLWALGAMVGCATYFIISADDTNGLPPLTLAAGGLTVGTVTLGLLGLVGLLPMRAATRSVEYADVTVAWWVPVLGLGLLTAAFSYTMGIAAIRRLGSRLASFVALTEVLAGVLWAWVLLDELPRAVQLLGGVLIVLGVVGVKLGERQLGSVSGELGPVGEGRTGPESPLLARRLDER
jgi:drug/metabolite transporter (DMT)-like permease